MWDFIQTQMLSMLWLNVLVGDFLTALGLDIASRFGSSVQFFIYDTIKILILLSVLIFGISYIQSFFPPERTRKILGRYSGLTANCLAALLGTVTPFCSCSSIPLFIGFTKAGLPLGVTFSFLISSPLVDLASLIILSSIFGWQIAIAYVIVGLIVAVIGGSIIEKMRMEDQIEDFAVAPSCCCKSAKNSSVLPTDMTSVPTATPLLAPLNPENMVLITPTNITQGTQAAQTTQLLQPLQPLPQASARGNTPSADNTENGLMTRAERCKYAYEQVVDTIKNVIWYILIGVGIGALIHNYIPNSYIQGILGAENAFSVIIATVIAIPIYADIFGTIPIAEALLTKDVGIGTILAFMMGVTALSLPSIIMIKKVIKTKLLILFVGIVTFGIILTGYLFNALQFLL